MKETVGVKGAALEVSLAKELNGLLCPPWRVAEVPNPNLGDSFKGNTCQSYPSLGGHCQVRLILSLRQGGVKSPTQRQQREIA